MLWHSIVHRLPCSEQHILALCRTRQSKLTSQTRVPRHQLPSDLLAAAHKQMHDGHSLWLFDIIYFPLGCYRKDLKKPLMIYRCGCTRGCFHSLKQPPLAVDVAIAIAGSYCTLALGSVGKTLPSLQCVMNEIHIVGFAWNNVSLLCVCFKCRRSLIIEFVGTNNISTWNVCIHRKSGSSI